jgi:hypothetical protein
LPIALFTLPFAYCLLPIAHCSLPFAHCPFSSHLNALFLQQIIFMNHVLLMHNILRWAVLLFGVWTVVNATTGVLTKRYYTGTDNKVNLFFMIACDIQLLIGLVLFFNNGWFTMLKENTKAVMKDGNLRFFALEHFLMMIIAWLLVHVGRTMSKRADTDAAKHKKSLIYFGIALVIILAMIPWPFRAFGRALFPSF